MARSKEYSREQGLQQRAGEKEHTEGESRMQRRSLQGVEVLDELLLLPLLAEDTGHLSLQTRDDVGVNLHNTNTRVKVGQILLAFEANPFHCGSNMFLTFANRCATHGVNCCMSKL